MAKPNDKYKPARTLIQMLIEIVAKDDNLLLNVGPTPDGNIPGEQLALLRQIGDWMRVTAAPLENGRHWRHDRPPGTSAMRACEHAWVLRYSHECASQAEASD